MDRLWLFAGREGEDEDAAPHGHVESYDLIHQEWKQEADVGHAYLEGSMTTALVVPERSEVRVIKGPPTDLDAKFIIESCIPVYYRTILKNT